MGKQTEKNKTVQQESVSIEPRIINCMTRDQEWLPRQQFCRKDIQFIMDYKRTRSHIVTNYKKTNIYTRTSTQNTACQTYEFACCKAHFSAFLYCTFNLYEFVWHKKIRFYPFLITTGKINYHTCGLFSSSHSINGFIQLSFKKLLQIIYWKL